MCNNSSNNCYFSTVFICFFSDHYPLYNNVRINSSSPSRMFSVELMPVEEREKMTLDSQLKYLFGMMDRAEAIKHGGIQNYRKC